MSDCVERMVRAYSDSRFVHATTKAEVIGVLNELRDEIATWEDFSSFPEGSDGVILYALLKLRARPCPDVGDFGHVLQGMQSALNASCDDIAETTMWHGSRA